MLPRAAGFAAAVVLSLVTLQAQRPSDLVNRTVTAKVVGVVDGDTVDVLIPPSRQVRVRLDGVDTPEAGEPFSQQARVFTRVLMFSRDVRLTGKDIDVYGRLVARIVVDNRDSSEALIAAGLGCTFHKYVTDRALDAAVSRAQSARLGFWATGAQRPACVAREAQALPRAPVPLLGAQPPPAATTTGRPVAASGFIGNVSSKVYHSPTCANAGCPNCTRKFTTRAEAEAAGYRPAGDCLAR